jgi:hypothetical protein
MIRNRTGRWSVVRIRRIAGLGWLLAPLTGLGRHVMTQQHCEPLLWRRTPDA